MRTPPFETTAELETTTSAETWERVLTINEYYDAPRRGVAVYHGVPHIYHSPFDSDRDAYSDYFRLAPIGPDLLQLVLDQWKLWERWQEAYHSGRVTIESHPCLPVDREAYDRLANLIGNRLEIADRQEGITCRAEFRETGDQRRQLEVRWRRVTD